MAQKNSPIVKCGNYEMILTCIPGVRRMFTRSVDLTRVFLGNFFSSSVSPENAITKKNIID